MTTEPATFGAPRGMRDFYPEDMALRNLLFDTWRQSARRFGFQPYDACVVESLDLLRRKAGEEISQQIYAFTDKSGRELALRPEMTPTLARMVVARYGQLSFPLKWFTIAQCFRYERMTRGRKREHYQWNLDIIGEESVSAEVEVLATALDALGQLGLGRERVRVRFSSRALLADLLRKLGIPEAHHAPTFLALDKKGKISDDEIRQLLVAEGLAEPVIADVFSLLGIRELADAERLLDGATPALENVRQFLALADTYGLGGALVFDIAVIRGLAYYTGIVFEAFDVAGQLRAIFGGGRYDKLLTQIGGPPATGVGLGFGDVVVAELLQEAGVTVPPPASDLAIGFMEEAQRGIAMRLAALVRRQGESVDLALAPDRKPGRFFGRAGKGGFTSAVYIGPDDVTAGMLRIKNLTTREERVVQVTDLPTP